MVIVIYITIVATTTIRTNLLLITASIQQHNNEIKYRSKAKGI